jgi:hypothetical protein
MRFKALYGLIAAVDLAHGLTARIGGAVFTWR